MLNENKPLTENKTLFSIFNFSKENKLEKKKKKANGINADFCARFHSSVVARAYQSLKCLDFTYSCRDTKSN